MTCLPSSRALGPLAALMLAVTIPAAAADPQPPGTPAAAPSPALTPRKGDVIKPFTAQKLDGTTQTVDFPKGGPTILVFFLSSCPACHKMLPEWSAMYLKRAVGVKMYGIVMDQEPPGFFVASPVSFPVLRSPGREFLKELNVQRVPTTVRVQPGGRVEDAVLGHLDPIKLGELFRP
jgi:hypothetical protein